MDTPAVVLLGNMDHACVCSITPTYLPLGTKLVQEDRKIGQGNNILTVPCPKLWSWYLTRLPGYPAERINVESFSIPEQIFAYGINLSWNGTRAFAQLMGYIASNPSSAP